MGVINNPSDSSEDLLQRLHTRGRAVYTVGQLERGESGTLHVQFCMAFKDAKTLTAMKRVHGLAHWEVVRNGSASYDYVQKADTRVDGPWSFGVRPVQHNSKTDWDRVRDLAKQGKFEEIPSEILVRHYQNLKAIKKDNMVVSDCDHLRGVWIYGRAGVGKSRYAREHYPGHYPKLCNKWWDGYQGQAHVIMDDIGPEHKCLAQQLKIWADRYGCVLETKGGAVVSEYQWFVVTSQYSIEEIFPDLRD